MIHPLTSTDHRRRPRRAFTLIELLVVISIISLLLSLILPSLAGAQRTSRRVVCMANLKMIGQGVHEYASDNDDWIIGSPAGSGAYLAGAGTWAYGPAIQRWDFMGPMTAMWGMGFARQDGQPPVPAGPGQPPQNGTTRLFDSIRNTKPFLCPANKFLATWFAPGGPPNAGTGYMISYNTCWYPLFREGSSGASIGFPGDGTGLSWFPSPSTHSEWLPKAWRPSVNKIGIAANKVFCADGARYSRPDQAPDYAIGVQAAWGGTFSSNPPYYFQHTGEGGASNGWDRTWAPGNIPRPGSVDGRIFAFRHATGEPKFRGPADSYKINLLFLDGHVETQGDLQASNPFQWLPRGTLLKAAFKLNDVRQRYNLYQDVMIGP